MWRLTNSPRIAKTKKIEFSAKAYLIGKDEILTKVTHFSDLDLTFLDELKAEDEPAPEAKGSTNPLHQLPDLVIFFFLFCVRLRSTS